MALKTKEIKRKQVLETRIRNWKDNQVTRGRKGGEHAFCKHIDSIMPKILGDMGYKSCVVAKEFQIPGRCRMDYLIKTDKGFLIVEVKKAYKDLRRGNFDVSFASGVGQLLIYRTILSIHFNIPVKKIDTALFIDVDSLMNIAMLRDSKLDMAICVIGDVGVKRYAKA